MIDSYTTLVDVSRWFLVGLYSLKPYRYKNVSFKKYDKNYKTRTLDFLVP